MTAEDADGAMTSPREPERSREVPTRHILPDDHVQHEQQHPRDQHDPVDPDERDLVERARTDRAAFAELYRRHVRAVHALAYRRSGSREVADEATSAAFERALRSIDRFEWRAGGIRPWLFRIVSNEVVEIYRRRARIGGRRGQLALRSLSIDEHPDAWARAGRDDPLPGADADTALPGGLDPAVLHAAIDRLSDRHRAVITLRYLAGLSAGDAADQLGWTKPALAVHLHRALKALRVELASGRDGGRDDGRDDERVDGRGGRS